MKIESLLQTINMFPFLINFQYKNQKLFHSVYGYILSIFMYFIMIFVFYYYSKDFFKKTNPALSFKEKGFVGNISFPLISFMKSFNYNFNFETSSGFYEKYFTNMKNITNPIFFFELYLSNPDKNFQNKIVFIEKININYKKNGNLTIDSNFELKDDLQVYSNITEEDFPMECTKTDKDCKIKNIEDVILKINSNSIIFFNILFKNPFKEIFLKDNLEIYDFNMGFELSDNVLNVDDNKFFKSYFFEELVYIPSLKLKNSPYQTYYFKYGAINLINDYGIFVSHDEEKFNMKKLFESSTMTNVEYQKIKIFELRIDKIIGIFERRYKKLQDVFSDLGGLMNLFILFGNIIIYSFNRKMFFYEIMNSIFGLEILEDKIEKANKIFHNGNFRRSNNYQYIRKKDSNAISNYNIVSKSINISDNSKNAVKSNKNNFSRRIGDMNSDVLKMDLFLNKNITEDKNIFELSNSKNCAVSPNKNYSNLNGLTILANQSERDKQDGENEKCFGIKNKIEKFINSQDKKENLLEINNGEFLKIFFCFNNFKNEHIVKKEKIFEKFEKKINEYIEIINHCKLFENFEKLKMIILNKNQNFSFNFIKRINIDDFSKENLHNNMENLYNYFKNERYQLNETDLRLLNFSNSNFIDFLNS